MANNSFNCQDSGCSTTGYCYPGIPTCQCRQTYIGLDCSKNIYTSSPGLWDYFLFHLVFFSTTALAIFIWSTIEIILMVSRVFGFLEKKTKFSGRSQKKKTTSREWQPKISCSVIAKRSGKDYTSLRLLLYRLFWESG
jgi:hypothetical protein